MGIFKSFLISFLQIDRNYEFKALPDLTLPTRDLKGIQEETLLDGELVYDPSQDCLIFYIFDALMFQTKSLAPQPLPARLQVIQNDVIAPWKARMKATGEPYPFQLRLKQMWKPYGLRELFERVIPAQGHENDGLIFTPVQDPYLAGTCHRLLKWKPSEMNSIDFLIVVNEKKPEDFELHIATNGVPHFYCKFDPFADDGLKDLGPSELNGKIAEFRYAGPDSWKFMRFRPDKRLPNDVKTVQKVIQSIQDNITRADLLEREGVIRRNWKAREGQQTHEEPPISLQPRSQLKYPMKLSKLEEPQFAWIRESKKRKLEDKEEEQPPKTREDDRKFSSNQDLNYDLSDSDS